MLSTLTARGEDGKRSKKIERNTRKARFCEILLCVMIVIVLMFARGWTGAQLMWAACQAFLGGWKSVIAGKPRSHRDCRRILKL
jgi:hypothetical protein